MQVLIIKEEEKYRATNMQGGSCRDVVTIKSMLSRRYV